MSYAAAEKPENASRLLSADLVAILCRIIEQPGTFAVRDAAVACVWRLARGKKYGAKVVKQLLELNTFKHIVPLMPPPTKKSAQPGDALQMVGSAFTVGEARQVNAIGAVAAALAAGPEVSGDVVEAVVRHGGVQALVAQLSPVGGGHPEARRHAADALWEMREHRELIPDILAADGVKYLAALSTATGKSAPPVDTLAAVVGRGEHMTLAPHFHPFKAARVYSHSFHGGCASRSN